MHVLKITRLSLNFSDNFIEPEGMDDYIEIEIKKNGFLAYRSQKTNFTEAVLWKIKELYLS